MRSESWWLDVTADGTVVRCNDLGQGQAPAVQFGNDAPMALPSHGLFLRAWGVEAIMQSQSGDVYRAVRGVGAFPIGRFYGTNACALNGSWLCVQVNQTSYERNGLTNPIPSIISGTSQGMLDLTTDGYPIWSDLHRQTVIKGVTFTLPLTRGDWTVGQGDDTWGIIAYHAPSDTLYGVVRSTPSGVAPHMAQLADGSCVVALSMPAAVIYSKDFQPYSTSPPIPPNPEPEPEPEPIPIPEDTMTSIVPESIAAAVIREEPHPDGDGRVLLTRGTSDLPYFTVENNGSVRWSNDKGAWQAFYPGNAYTAVRDNGVVWIIQKGGTWQ